jgi:hypothetical protein
MSSYDGTLTDDGDDLGLGFVTVNYSFTYTIDPGDPGCWRTQNGDGWPETPASVELEALEIVSVLPTDGSALPVSLTASWIQSVKEWADRRIELAWETIEQEILQDSAEPSYDDD